MRYRLLRGEKLEEIVEKTRDWEAEPHYPSTVLSRITDELLASGEIVGEELEWVAYFSPDSSETVYILWRTDDHPPEPVLAAMPVL